MSTYEFTSVFARELARYLTKRAEGSAMALFAHGGDPLPPELADQAVARILEVLRTDGPVRQFGRGWADRWSEIGAALARLLKTLTELSSSNCSVLTIPSP